MNQEWPSPSPTQSQLTGPARDLVIIVQKLVYAFARHWLFAMNAVVFLYLIGAAVPPMLMAAEQKLPADILYTAYGFTCHQLPERSYFLFGPGGPIETYNVDTILRQGADPDNLRAFRGNEALGYKFAVSDRMVSMYGGTLLAGLLYALLRRRGVRLPPLPFWALVLFALPMAVDGFTHLIDDVTGIGWRATNSWAVPILGESMGPAFYTGTDWGSLNSLLRLFTGLLFGIGTVWFAYPLIGFGFDEITELGERREARARREANHQPAAAALPGGTRPESPLPH